MQWDDVTFDDFFDGCVVDRAAKRYAELRASSFLFECSQFFSQVECSWCLGLVSFSPLLCDENCSEF